MAWLASLGAGVGEAAGTIGSTAADAFGSFGGETGVGGMGPATPSSGFLGGLSGGSEAAGQGLAGNLGNMLGGRVNQRAGGFPGLMSAGLGQNSGGGLADYLASMPQLQAAVKVLGGGNVPGKTTGSGLLTGGLFSGLLSGR